MTATIVVAAGSAGRLDAAHRVAGDLAVLGIAVDVRARPLAEVEALIAKGDFDLALVPEDADDPARASERWRGLVDPWFDILSDAARAASGREEKRPLYAELQRIWSDARPALPLYQRLRIDVAIRTLAGIQAPPSDTALTWNAAEWRFQAP